MDSIGQFGRKITIEHMKMQIKVMNDLLAELKKELDEMRVDHPTGMSTIGLLYAGGVIGTLVGTIRHAKQEIQDLRKRVK